MNTNLPIASEMCDFKKRNNKSSPAVGIFFLPYKYDFVPIFVVSSQYLGSSQIMSPQSPNKAVRMEQAQEAVGRIKVGEKIHFVGVIVWVTYQRPEQKCFSVQRLLLVARA